VRSPDDARADAGRAETPIGPALLVGLEGVLTGLYLDPDTRRAPAGWVWDPDGGRLDHVRQQLAEYFDGTRTEFTIPVQPAGTPFQQLVWAALLAIPFGGTATYGQIAARLGRPRASRAVGAANGRNPISIVVPCHRVVGHDGGLTGYGWGVDAKAWLLEHERAGLFAPLSSLP
jgi:methylated-DNA-[protein]-cysteine S-methyltransferase